MKAKKIYCSIVTSNSNIYKWLVVGGVCILIVACVVAAPATGVASIGGIAFVV